LQKKSGIFGKAYNYIGTYFFQNRHYQVPDFISCKIRFQIGGIRPVRNIVHSCIVFNQGTGHIQQRPDNVSRLFPHTAQSPDACPPGKVKQQGFCFVIGVVGYGCVRITFFLGESLKPLITKLPGGHFQRNSLFGGIIPCKYCIPEKWNMIFFCPGAHEIAIPVTFCSPERKIHMSDR